MSLSERISQAQQAAVDRGAVAGVWRAPVVQPVVVDGIAEFKAKVHDLLFERLGTRLFEASNQDQLHALGRGRDRRADGRRPRRRCRPRSASTS